MSRSKRKFLQYQDMISHLYPELHKQRPDGKRVLSRSFTFQVTDDCNLACTYCYQINKGKRRMSLETAKKCVDMLLNSTEENNSYINPSISPAIILEFIGGEPLMEVELISQIVEYFKRRTIELNHPWATMYCISICSNGTLYFDEKVQKFLNRNRRNMSFSITIDGNKELHDSCRVFHDGRPSYDLAVAAAKDWMSKGNYMGSKITIAPENISFLYASIVEMIRLGYDEINANCVYEKGWTSTHATVLYDQMKRIADYLLKNDLDDVYISLFEEEFFKPKPETDNQNWCGGTGDMLSVDPDGYFYPCIRYMESSLGGEREPIRIGHVDTGLVTTTEEKNTVHCLNCISRRSQSTDECFYCPIADGCAWCSAYNYQVFGTVDKRATYICEMHKARSLANVYFWNKFYQKNQLDRQMELHCPKEWAINIISEQEYEMLQRLAAGKECV